MNFSQRFGLFILILISVSYVYFSFFNNKTDDIKPNKGDNSSYSPLHPQIEEKEISKSSSTKVIKIFLLDNSGEIKSVKRICDPEAEKSCFEFAINELIKAPTKQEKAKGYTSEIPVGTKVLSLRESANTNFIDLSSMFESGGGAESTYVRVKQIIKTVNANTSTPTYLYINGKQANVIGGEGIMIKQPLSERSFDE